MSLDFGIVPNYRAVTPGLLSMSGETMGTHWLVRLAGVRAERLPALRSAVEAVFERVIEQMSLWLPDSVLSLYNAAATGTWHVLPRDLRIVLDAALRTAEESSGAFDPSVGALIELWGFGPAQRRAAPPEPELIEACLARTGWRRLRLSSDGERLLQPGGLRLDLSGVAKGHAVDSAAETLQAMGVDHCLVEIGGELVARGHRPDGSAWRVGVEAPAFDRVEALLAVPLSGCGIATSGDRWHGFEHSGRRYSHTIDPRNGWPVPERLASVTVVHDGCMSADALATALYVLGLPEGPAFANRHGVAALFLERAEQGISAVRSLSFERLLGRRRSVMNLSMEPQRLVAAALIVLFWIAWVWLVLRKTRRRDAASGHARNEAPILVAFASQTGVASSLALRSADRLREAGLAVRLEPLGRIGADDLLAAGRALFLVSTCGEGDAPDDAFGFVRRMSLAGPSLEKVDFAVLALGDRKYSNFCAFGRRLESWLLQQGARRLAERIDVDGHDLGALARWETLLPGLAGASSPSTVASSQTSALGLAHTPALGFAQTSALASPPASPFESALASGVFTPWRLALRESMNPNSAGEPVLRLRLIAPSHPGRILEAGTTPSWQAGDLVQIEVPTGGLPALREYSIASIPQEGAIELFVRMQRGTDGELGLASRWLSGGSLQQSLEVGEIVSLRLRANSHFRLGAGPCVPLILIGAGSGLAGLRSLIRARQRAGARRNWLFFGERNRAHDFLCREEIEGWLDQGVLERFDPVFSRDDAQRRYVQHRLHEQAIELQRWVGEGAWIHVCGSRERLGVAVDAALEQILGLEAFAGLRESGRYRRDLW